MTLGPKCFVHNSTQNEAFWDLNTDSESSRRDLYNGSVKTLFKAINKSRFFVLHPSVHQIFTKRFLNRFKSCFDTASLKISTRAFRIRIQISKRSIGRRAVVILLREKNFGPNVILRFYIRRYAFRMLDIRGLNDGGVMEPSGVFSITALYVFPHSTFLSFAHVSNPVRLTPIKKAARYKEGRK